MTDSVRFFREWAFDRSKGEIRGLGALDARHLPARHCRLVVDADRSGLLMRLEEHRPGQELPAIKVLGYGPEPSRQIAEALDYNPDGSLRTIHKYLYDEQGRLIDRHEFDGQGQPRGRVESHWDEQGREAAEVVFTAQGECREIHRYAYDAQGRRSEEREFDGQDTLRGVRQLRYDEAGRVSEKLWLAPEGQLQSRFVHEYEGDILVAVRLYDAQGVLLGRQPVE